MILKRCNDCKEEKQLNAFGKRGNGLKGTCKDCKKIENRNAYYKDHEATKEYKRLSWHKCELRKILKERE